MQVLTKQFNLKDTVSSIWAVLVYNLQETALGLRIAIVAHSLT